MQVSWHKLSEVNSIYDLKIIFLLKFSILPVDTIESIQADAVINVKNTIMNTRALYFHT